tara:strand:- start:97 stop:318 length:222 start_codon:yes stop_codon:yes gene_type:complete
MQISIEENPVNPEDFDCCPNCGSLGTVHFEDKDDSQLLHRCLRCNGEFYGCTSSISFTPAERLSNVTETNRRH